MIINHYKVKLPSLYPCFIYTCVSKSTKLMYYDNFSCPYTLFSNLVNSIATERTKANINTH